jgi:hypothetical protein
MDMAEIAEYEETQRLLDEGVVGYLPEKISNRMLKRLVRLGLAYVCVWRGEGGGGAVRLLAICALVGRWTHCYRWLLFSAS